MSTEITKASNAGEKINVAEEAQESERPQEIGEGLGVFRGLLLMFLGYGAFGFLAWWVWHVFRHWRGH